MSIQNWFENELEKSRQTFDYRLEDLLYTLGEQLCRYMEEQKLSRAQLAERLGCNRAYVTKILNGNPNLTVKSLLRIADAIGCDLYIEFSSIGQMKTSTVPQAEPSTEPEYENPKEVAFAPEDKVGDYGGAEDDLPIAA